MLAYAPAFLVVRAENRWLVGVVQPCISHRFTGLYLHEPIVTRIVSRLLQNAVVEFFHGQSISLSFRYYLLPHPPHEYIMAEIFGAVAAGIGIGSELIRLGRAIQKAIVKIKNSRRDIERLAHETITFVGIYKTFLRTCENDEHTYTTEASAIQLLITLAQKTCDGLSQLLESVEALQPQSKIKSQLEESLIARLVWFRSENRVKALRASLSVAKESISCFANLMQLSAFNAHIKELKEALNDRSKRRALEQQLGVPLEARIEKIELEM